MLTTLARQTAAGLRILLVLTVLLGIAYPLAVWGIGHLPRLSGNAEGSVITSADGTAVGSSQIGVDPVPADANVDPFFHTRPSASAKDVLGPGDPSVSGGSNRAGDNPDLLAATQKRRELIAAREGVAPQLVPPDAVTASASGVDPDISPEYAELQVARVAKVTGLSVDRVRALVAQNTDGRKLGFLGEPGVNVTTLNLAIQAAR
jgi:K+-transporting ATPase ATPase C chain